MNDELNQDIKGILNQIVGFNPELYWEINCAYTDGLNTTLLSLTINERQPRKTIGRVMYRKETGKVDQYFYRGLPRKQKNASVTDILLEILSLEKGANSSPQ